VLPRDLQPLALQPLGIKRDVPCRERAPREGFQRGQFTLRGGSAHGGEMAQEVEHGGRISRHLGRERVLGVVGEPREDGDLVP
jgi:hypothetical protein